MPLRGLKQRLRALGGGQNYEANEALLAEVANGESPAVVAMLRDPKKVSLRYRNEKGNCALHVAAIHNRTEIGEVLLQLAVDTMSKRNREGETPLHLAVLHDNADFVMLLCRKRVDVEALLKDKTPLMLCAEKGFVRCAHALIQQGARPDAKNPVGKTAFDFATSPEMMNLLDEAQNGVREPAHHEVIVDENVSIPVRQQYKMLKRIGEGAYAATYSARNIKYNFECVVKIQAANNLDDINSSLAEGLTLSLFKDCNRIVGFKDFYIDVNNHDEDFKQTIKRLTHTRKIKPGGRDGTGSVYLGMEWARGGDLFTLVSNRLIAASEKEDQLEREMYERGINADFDEKDFDISVEPERFTEDEICRIVSQVCEALAEIHRAGLIHRDVKPGNIFLDENQNVILGDFGIAKFIEESNHPDQPAHTVVGSQNYMASEMHDTSKPYTQSVDMFAVGCVIFFLAKMNHPNFFMRDAQTQVLSEMRGLTTDFIYEMVERLWDPVSEKRPTAEMVIEWCITRSIPPQSAMGMPQGAPGSRKSPVHDLHMPKGGNHSSVSGDGRGTGRNSKPKKIALRRRYAVGRRIEGDQDLYRARHLYTKKKFMMKRTVCRSIDDVNDCLAEAAHLSHLRRGRRILAFQDLFIDVSLLRENDPQLSPKNNECDPSTLSVCIVFQPVHSNVSDFLKDFLHSRETITSYLPESLILKWLMQAADGLTTVHEAGVVHRNINLLHLYLDKKRNLFIGDFGSAKDTRVFGKSQTLIGPAVYQAPELSNPATREYGQGEADMYALGVTLVELLTLEPPRFAQSPAIPAPYCDIIHALVARLIEHDPRQRMTAIQLFNDAREHEHMHEECDIRIHEMSKVGEPNPLKYPNQGPNPTHSMPAPAPGGPPNTSPAFGQQQHPHSQNTSPAFPQAQAQQAHTHRPKMTSPAYGRPMPARARTAPRNVAGPRVARPPFHDPRGGPPHMAPRHAHSQSAGAVPPLLPFANHNGGAPPANSRMGMRPGGGPPPPGGGNNTPRAGTTPPRSHPPPQRMFTNSRMPHGVSPPNSNHSTPPHSRKGSISLSQSSSSSYSPVSSASSMSSMSSQSHSSMHQNVNVNPSTPPKSSHHLHLPSQDNSSNMGHHQNSDPSSSSSGTSSGPTLSSTSLNSHHSLSAPSSSGGGSGAPGSAKAAYNAHHRSSTVAASLMMNAAFQKRGNSISVASTSIPSQPFPQQNMSQTHPQQQPHSQHPPSHQQQHQQQSAPPPQPFESPTASPQQKKEKEKFKGFFGFAKRMRGSSGDLKNDPDANKAAADAEAASVLSALGPNDSAVNYKRMRSTSHPNIGDIAAEAARSRHMSISSANTAHNRHQSQIFPFNGGDKSQQHQQPPPPAASQGQGGQGGGYRHTHQPPQRFPTAGSISGPPGRRGSPSLGLGRQPSAARHPPSPQHLAQSRAPPSSLAPPPSGYNQNNLASTSASFAPSSSTSPSSVSSPAAPRRGSVGSATAAGVPPAMRRLAAERNSGSGSGRGLLLGGGGGGGGSGANTPTSSASSASSTPPSGSSTPRASPPQRGGPPHRFGAPTSSGPRHMHTRSVGAPNPRMRPHPTQGTPPSRPSPPHRMNMPMPRPQSASVSVGMSGGLGRAADSPRGAPPGRPPFRRGAPPPTSSTPPPTSNTPPPSGGNSAYPFGGGGAPMPPNSGGGTTTTPSGAVIHPNGNISISFASAPAPAASPSISTSSPAINRPPMRGRTLLPRNVNNPTRKSGGVSPRTRLPASPNPAPSHRPSAAPSSGAPNGVPPRPTRMPIASAPPRRRPLAPSDAATSAWNSSSSSLSRGSSKSISGVNPAAAAAASDDGSGATGDGGGASCSQCGCSTFTQHAFRPICSHCFHAH